MDFDSLSSTGKTPQLATDSTKNELTGTHRLADSYNKLWMEKYESLIAFKNANGHCKVTSTNANKSLAIWVGNQRSFQRSGKLRKDRQQLLDEIGFVWSKQGPPNGTNKLLDTHWKKRYERLVAFKEKNGHCKVPVAEDEQLTWWLNSQRKEFRSGKLKKDRQELLEKIGFIWNVRKSPIKAVPGTPVPTGRASRNMIVGEGLSAKAPPVETPVAAIPRAKRTKTPVATQKFPIGTRIEKIFEVDQGEFKPFGGKVVSFEEFDEEDGTPAWGYVIHYDDGDKEDMLESEVEKHVVVVKSKKRKRKSQGQFKPDKRLKEVGASDRNMRSTASAKEKTEAVSLSKKTEPYACAPSNERKYHPLSEKDLQVRQETSMENWSTAGDESTVVGSQQALSNQLPDTNPSHERFANGTRISITRFDLSDNERGKSYGGKVVDYVYVEKERDWFYFIKYDDGATEYMSEWEVTVFSASA